LRQKQIKDYFLACRDQCREETKDIRKTWDALLGQYLCKKDFGEKKDWQFKIYTPIGKPKIKKAVRLIKKNLITTGSYFDFDNPPKLEDKLKKCHLTKRALELYLREAGFIDELSIALESGFTLGLMIMKFWVAEEEDHYYIDADKAEIVYPKRPKMRCKAINPFNFYFTRDNQINIEEEWLTLTEFKQMVDESPGIYNKSEVKKLLAGDYQPTENLADEDKKRIQKLGLRDAENKYRKEVKLAHFYGPITTEKNELFMANAQMLIANDKYLVLGPRENPFWHKKSPYIYASPLNVLFRHVGKGLIEDVMGVEDAIVEFVNLQLDNLLWKILGIHEVDDMAFSEFGRADLRELYPGKFVRRRSGYQGSSYQFHDIGVDPAKAMPMLQELKTLYDEEIGVTQYVEALPGATSEKATIYAGRRQTALSDFQSIALDIERGFMTKCFDMARDLMIQYLMVFDNPDLEDIFRENELDLAEMTDAEKRAMIVTDVDFIGKGISIFFEREQLIQKIGAYVKMLNALPGTAQLYPNWPVIIKRFNEAFSFDKPEEMLHSDQEVAQLQAQMQQAQQAQMIQQMQLMQQAHQHELEKINLQNQPKLLDIQRKYESEEADRKAKLIAEAMK